MPAFVCSSRLAASPREVWAQVATLRGVNDELWPVVRMTTPRGAVGDVVRTGRLGRSWLLAGGVLPIDYDDLEIVALEPERGFRERSKLGSARSWHHDRELVPIEGGCRVVDRVAFEPRVRALAGLQAFAFEATFRWRHRRLRRRFGVAPA